jgi:hypothetical protein
MTTTQAAEILAAHNAWRREDDHNTDHAPTPMQDPKEVGRAIDLAVALLRAYALADAMLEARSKT